jgi:hypothetical protein
MKTVVTAIFAGYERPKAPPPGADRAVLLTDTVEDDRWEIIRRKDHGIGPRRLFFTAKLTPHIFVTDEDDVIWIDGSMEPTGKDIGSFFEQVPPGGVGIYEHHGRDGATATGPRPSSPRPCTGPGVARTGGSSPWRKPVTTKRAASPARAKCGRRGSSCGAARRKHLENAGSPR